MRISVGDAVTFKVHGKLTKATVEKPGVNWTKVICGDAAEELWVSNIHLRDEAGRLLPLCD